MPTDHRFHTAPSSMLQRALSLHRSGNLGDARPLYERLLELDPDDADTLHYLGVLLYQCGEHAEAEKRIREAIAHNRSQADYFNHLGEVLRAEARLEEAAQCYGEALRLAPQHPAAHNNLGLCLVALDQAERSLEHFRMALYGNTPLAEAGINLGDTLRSLGRLADALDAYASVQRGSGQWVTAELRRGYTLLLLGRHEDALGCFGSLRAAGVAELPALLGLAEAHAGLGNTHAAIETFRRALGVDERCGAAHGGLARVFERTGESARAIDAWRAAIDVEPGEREHYLDLAALYERAGSTAAALEVCEAARETFPNDIEILVLLGLALVAEGRHAQAVEQLEPLLANYAGDAALHNALGIALQRSGRIEQAKRCFCRAIELVPGFATGHSNLGASLLASGELQAARRELEHAVELDPYLAGAWQNLSGIKRERPANRAHIARVQGLLDRDALSDSDRASFNFALGKMYEDCGEFDQAFAHFETANALRRAGVSYDPARHGAEVERIVSMFDRTRLQRGLNGASGSEQPVFILGMPRSGTTLVEQILSSHPRVHAAGELGFFDELTLRSTAEQAPARKYIDCLDELDAQTVRLLADTYLRRLTEDGAHATVSRATDKMLSNYLHLGLIHMLFPRARFVYCRRDPMDVCVSIFTHAFTDMPFAWDLQEIGRYYRQYELLMRHWQESFADAVVLELQYERLVADQQTVTRELLDYCELPFDRACVDFHRNTRHVLTASDWQVRQPMYSSSVGRWKHYAEHLAPLRLALG